MSMMSSAEGLGACCCMVFLLVGASQDEKQKAPSISGGALGIRASRSHTQSTPAVCGRGGGGDVAKSHAFIMIVAVAGCQAASP